MLAALFKSLLKGQMGRWGTNQMPQIAFQEAGVFNIKATPDVSPVKLRAAVSPVKKPQPALAPKLPYDFPARASPFR